MLRIKLARMLGVSIPRHFLTRSLHYILAAVMGGAALWCNHVGLVMVLHNCSEERGLLWEKSWEVSLNQFSHLLLSVRKGKGWEREGVDYEDETKPWMSKNYLQSFVEFCSRKNLFRALKILRWWRRVGPKRTFTDTGCLTEFNKKVAIKFLCISGRCTRAVQ